MSIHDLNHPIPLFLAWWKKATLNSPLSNKNAVCLSTINAAGFPESRFVDLKHVDEEGFVFCTSLVSPKAQNIAKNNKVALTLWWDHVGLQVRLMGYANPIASTLAEHYWHQRHVSAQITSMLSQQSQPMELNTNLREDIHQLEQHLHQKTIEKPEDWGGFRVSPLSLEFLTFQSDRFHLRERFTLSDETWTKTLLQP